MSLLVMARATLYCDGASKGNPGPAAIGAVLYNEDGSAASQISKAIGNTTNNVAEYKALIAGLQKAHELGIENLSVFMDSELAVKQIKGIYKVKNAGLKPLYQEAKALIMKFDSFEIGHVLRDKNKEADRLANEALK